jgi:hypothetical protein
MAQQVGVNEWSQSMNPEYVKQKIEKQNIESIDLKYADLVGNWYHITFPTRRLDHVLKNGIPFDGSSIPGMKSGESGDMVLLPDPTRRLWILSQPPASLRNEPLLQPLALHPGHVYSLWKYPDEIWN